VDACGKHFAIGQQHRPAMASRYGEQLINFFAVLDPQLLRFMNVNAWELGLLVQLGMALAKATLRS
jgi:hypothetical protein